MKDIDFDELDKAVNSLMASSGKGSGTGDGDESPRVNVVDLDSAKAGTAVSIPSLDSRPDTDERNQVPVAVSRSSTPKPPERRGGRFMDMVQTSSAMKSRVAQPAPRDGVVIAPRPEVATGIGNDAETTSPNQDTDTMPDPIGMKNTPEPAANESSTVGAGSGLSIPPAETPFLSDAKVEKRPLNPGNSSLVQANEAATNVELTSTDGLINEGRGEDEPPAVPEIPELKPDLVAIEADSNVPETQAVDTADVSKDVAKPAVPLGATSIAQQYVSQQSSGDQSHAAIYDASQYPEPVHHPAKNKSGWLWIVWVVLLLGVGAGGALVLYKLGIIP